MVNFGAQSTPAVGGTGTGFSFGAQPIANPNTTSSGFSFGQPQAIAAAPSTNKSLFMSGTGTGSGGFSFGNPSSTTAATSALTVPTTSASGFTLGGVSSGGLTLGQPTAAPATSASGFSFNATPAATIASGFSFGSTCTPAATTTGFSFCGTPAATTTGFSFGGTPVATATGFNLTPATTTAAATSGFSFGLGGTTATTTPSSGFSLLGSGLKVPSSQGAGVSSGVGLGGAQPPSASTDANSAGSKTDGKSTKDQQMPQDLFGTIALFESRRSAENSASEENIRQTAAPFHKVGNKAVEIQKHLAELASEYLQLHASAVTLKAEVMKEAEHVEMSRRTKETPMALQGENKAPEVFFINLVRSFEAEMIYCRTKIEEVAQCMQALNNPCETPEDISEVLQREHETLKELAARIYSQHAQLVELSQILKTKTTPNEHAFFRSQFIEDTKTPPSAVVRPVVGVRSSGLQVFQEQQQRAKAVTLGAAPPTMPLAQATTPSIFSSGPNTSSLFSTGGTLFGTSSFNLGNSTTAITSPFGAKPLFGNVTSSNFGNTSAVGPSVSRLVQQTASPFVISSPFNTKPFGS